MTELTDFFFSRKPFTTILNCGTTKSTSTFQEGRLGWTLTRPSYRLIGTHRLTRSVLEWRSVSSSSLLSSIIRSLYSLIADGKYRATSLGRNTWKKLIGSRASLQLNCNMEGFNVFKTTSKARIGILGNEYNNCYKPDSRIGFGTGGYPDDSNTCGNEALHGGDNGDQHIKAMGYILVQ